MTTTPLSPDEVRNLSDGDEELFLSSAQDEVNRQLKASGAIEGTILVDMSGFRWNPRLCAALQKRFENKGWEVGWNYNKDQLELTFRGR